MRVVFVILHYLAEKDTLECISSILNCVLYDNKYIIVVDNASSNGSFENIEAIYRDNDKVILLKNKYNLGFARGNNIGFEYAKKELNADFIVLLNNDTIIKQKDFCDVLVNKYFEKDFYVLGPDIVTKDNFHQNPLRHKEWTECKLKMFKLKTQIRLLDRKVLGLGPIIARRKKKLSARTTTQMGDYTNIKLHGACLIFSPKYINVFDGLDPGTFLYMEEDLLQIEMDYYHYSMWYTSDLKVFHKEDVSTNMIEGNDKEKDIRFLKNLIASTDVCIKRVHTMMGNK